MTKELIENTNLPIKQDLKLELILYKNYSYLFFSLYKDIKVAIKKLKKRHTIFVIKARNHNLVLKQLFMNFMNFN